MLTADVRAINTLEKRYDVTIDDYTLYSERPSQWRIDGIWRECYLSDSTYAHADKALLVCDMVDPEKPKYAELGTAASADPTPVIIVD